MAIALTGRTSPSTRRTPTSHAAALMWAHGLDDPPATVAFEQPAGMSWQVATQAASRIDALEFTAPNLQYLMDSPVEFGPIASGSSPSARERSGWRWHHTGSDGDADAFAKDAEKIVRQEGAILRRVPGVRTGLYTFSFDHLHVRGRRRHGAPQQHRDPPRRRRRVARGCTTPSRTVLFTAGTWSASGR